MTSLRSAFHSVDVRPGADPINEKKNSLRSATKHKAQLRLVDVNRSANEGASVESNSLKCGKTGFKSGDSGSGIDKTDEKDGPRKNGPAKDSLKMRNDQDGAGNSKKTERKTRSNKAKSKKNERVQEANPPKEVLKGDVEGESPQCEQPAVSRKGSLQTVDAHVQTEVTVSDDRPEVTPADLVSATVSAAYWRALAHKLESQLDEQLVENCRLFTVLSEIRSDISAVEEETEEVMQFVNDAIARGQSTDLQA